MPTLSAAKLARLVGTRLREARTRAGMSQAEFATSGRVSRDAVIRLEAGERAARLDTLVRLANAVKVPLSELLASDEASTPQSAARLRIERQLDELSDDGVKLAQSLVESLLAYEHARKP